MKVLNSPTRTRCRAVVPCLHSLLDVNSCRYQHTPACAVSFTIPREGVVKIPVYYYSLLNTYELTTKQCRPAAAPRVCVCVCVRVCAYVFVQED